MSCLAIPDSHRHSTSSLEQLNDSFSRPRSLPATPGPSYQSPFKIEEKKPLNRSIDLKLSPKTPTKIYTHQMTGGKQSNIKGTVFHKCSVVISPLKWPTNDSPNVKTNDKSPKMETRSKRKYSDIGNSPVY